MDSDKDSFGNNIYGRTRTSSTTDESKSTPIIPLLVGRPTGKMKFLSGASFKLRKHKSLMAHRAEDLDDDSLYGDHLGAHSLSQTGSLSMDMNNLDSSINTFNLRNIHNINSGIALTDTDVGANYSKLKTDVELGLQNDSDNNRKEIKSVITDGKGLEAKAVKYRPPSSHQNPQQEVEELAIMDVAAVAEHSHPDINVSHVRTSSNASEHIVEDEENRIRRVKQKQIRTLNHGIRRFNLNPKKGLKYLQDNGVIKTEDGDMGENAKRVAKFLRTTRGLNKEQIGLVLGDEDIQCVRILHEYMYLFNFTEDGATIYGVEIGLRKVLALFKPPGEGQKIDRILDAFSKKFVLDNKSSFQAKTAEFNADTTYIIAYLIIMLNVDLHNPNNANRRMNKKTFVERCRKLDDGKDLPLTEVGNLYSRILENEIKLIMDRDDISGNLFTNPDKCGWLLKKGSGSMARWKRRWFILSENTLYYFKNSEDVEPQGFIPLENIQIVGKDSAYQNKFKSPVPYARPTSPSVGSSENISSPNKVSTKISENLVKNADIRDADTDAVSVTATLKVAEGKALNSKSETHLNTANNKNRCGTLVSNSASSISTNASSMPQSTQSSGTSTGRSLTSFPDSWSEAASKWLWTPRRVRLENRRSLRNVLSLSRFRYKEHSGYASEADTDVFKRGKSFRGFGCTSGSEPRSSSSASSYIFEMCPCDPTLKVKSAKVSRYGDLVLGQHRTIKLRADSRQEAQDWIGVLNQKRMFHNTIETIRGRTGNK